MCLDRFGAFAQEFRLADRCSKRSGTGLGDRMILLAGAAADADGTDDLAVAL